MCVSAPAIYVPVALMEKLMAIRHQCLPFFLAQVDGTLDSAHE